MDQGARGGHPEKTSDGKTSARPSSRSAQFGFLEIVCLAAAAALLTYLFIQHAQASSRLIDGVRFYWLDDDQMISMRYARNLVEGHGLCWNPGERVEGYTNLLWTLVMAVVHTTGISDAKASLVMRGVALLLMIGVLVLARQLLRRLGIRSVTVLAVALLCIVTCMDVVYWATSGFETSLLTFLQLLFLVRVLGPGKDDLVAFGALALIPVVRADALHIWAGNVVLVLLLSKHRRTTYLLLGATLLPWLAQLGFRLAYYEEWFPNTYYLKVVGLANKHRLGLLYDRNFLVRYAVPICLAVGTGIAKLETDKKIAALFTSLIPTLAYCVLTGGDNFGPFRFFAHVLPVLFVFAAAGARRVPRSVAGRRVWLAVLIVSCVPFVDPVKAIAPPNHNGDPYQQITVAALLTKNASPESTVAVVPAGIVPYFTRLHALDIMGVNDKHLARLPYRRHSFIGHGKTDPEYTLAQKPDLVVSCRSESTARRAPQHLIKHKERDFDYVLSFLASDTFREKYLPNPIANPYLHQWTAVFTTRLSPEFENRKSWQPVVVEP